MTNSYQISKTGSSTKTNPQVNLSDCRSLIDLSPEPPANKTHVASQLPL